jgi:hypothetical protein
MNLTNKFSSISFNTPLPQNSIPMIYYHLSCYSFRFIVLQPKNYKSIMFCHFFGLYSLMKIPMFMSILCNFMSFLYYLLLINLLDPAKKPVRPGGGGGMQMGSCPLFVTRFAPEFIPHNHQKQTNKANKPNSHTTYLLSCMFYSFV